MKLRSSKTYTISPMENMKNELKQAKHQIKMLNIKIEYLSECKQNLRKNVVDLLCQLQNNQKNL